MRSTVDLSTRKIGVVLNTASGSCTEESGGEIEALLKKHGLRVVRIWCSDSDELPQAFAEVEKRELDVLIVLGGDGTIRSAAELAGGTDLLVLPLPGGTMNVLPKALYGDAPWKDILPKVLGAPAVRSISGGEVAGHRFFISAMCGAPTLWVHAREDVRDHEIGAALKHGKRAFERMFSEKIHYQFNEMHEGDAEAVTITCPLVASTLEDERQALEAAVIDVNHAADVLALATAAAFGQWRDSEKVSVVVTKQVTLSSSHALPIIVDGEAIDVGREAEVVFLPDAFQALVTADEILP